MISLVNEEPIVICLTVHHLIDYEMDASHIPKYKLEARYCSEKLKNGGVCIYIQDDLNFATINLQKYCKERDIEIVTIRLKLKEKKVIIFCIYRALLGNYYFLNKLDYILNSFHRYNSQFIICGDININYLENNNRKSKLDDMLNTYNLRGTLYFPTRIANNSAT
jgi:exonuclease III